MLRASAIWGDVSLAALKGKTHRQAPKVSAAILAPRVTQVQQTLLIDIMFVRGLVFLLSLLDPLGLLMVRHLADMSLN